jgi:hypothetical protein
MNVDLTVIPMPPNRSGLMPKLPPQLVTWALKDALENLRNPHPDIGLPAAYPASVQAEAKHALTNLEQFAAPVTEDVLRIWLAPIPVVVRNEKSPEAIAGWVAGVAMTVGHLEIGAFTDETQREALSTFKFFPAAADVYEIVAGPAVRIRETICHLRRVADAPTIDNAVKADTAGGNAA